MPALDEVKARVREDVQKTKAVEAARQKADGARGAARRRGDFTAAAKAAGARGQDHRPHRPRRRRSPTSAMSAAVDAAAFALPQGGVSDPIVTDTGAVIVKVLEKQSPTRRRAQDRARRGEERAPEPAETALLRRPT